MTSPTFDTLVGVADFTIDRFGVWVAGTIAGDGGETTGGPVGGCPVAVAVSSTLPLFRSAWVTVYVPVQVSDAPEANVGFGHVGPLVNAPAGATCVSATLTFVKVTFPVLV